MLPGLHTDEPAGPRAPARIAGCRWWRERKRAAGGGSISFHTCRGPQPAFSPSTRIQRPAPAPANPLVPSSITNARWRLHQRAFAFCGQTLSPTTPPAPTPPGHWSSGAGSASTRRTTHLHHEAEAPPRESSRASRRTPVRTSARTSTSSVLICFARRERSSGTSRRCGSRANSSSSGCKGIVTFLFAVQFTASAADAFRSMRQCRAPGGRWKRRAPGRRSRPDCWRMPRHRW